MSRVLNRAITHAIKSGKLLVDDPLDEGGIKPKTFRLQGQPVVCVRRLGPRSVGQVPPSELLELLTRVNGIQDAQQERLDAVTLKVLEAPLPSAAASERLSKVWKSIGPKQQITPAAPL
jgi:hypothetical protein